TLPSRPGGLVGLLEQVGRCLRGQLEVATRTFRMGCDPDDVEIDDTRVPGSELAVTWISGRGAARCPREVARWCHGRSRQGRASGRAAAGRHDGEREVAHA